jgi:hypothetical protein
LLERHVTQIYQIGMLPSLLHMAVVFFLMGEKTCLLIALEPFDLHAFMDSYFCNIVPQLSYCYYYCCESCICAAAEFAADITIISAGFDAARGDPLGGCDVRFLLILIAKL